MVVAGASEFAKSSLFRGDIVDGHFFFNTNHIIGVFEFRILFKF